MRLLSESGFITASEVEFRIDPDAHPKPDVIATKNKVPSGPYPTEGVDVVVEIISDDEFAQVKRKCRKYQEWGCGLIYVVDPSDRSVSEWRDSVLIRRSDLAGLATDRIWAELDNQYRNS